MKISKNLAKIQAIAGIAVVSATVSTSFSVAPAIAQTRCQCTTYVANARGLSRNFPHAGDWDNGYMQNNGYRRVQAQPGAIVVMERSFPGANTAFGHVGIVQSIDRNGRLTVRGGNQSVGTPFVTEAGCNNVRSTQFARSINGRSDISFWMK